MPESLTPSAVLSEAFSARLLAWQAQQGRRGLPWQNSRKPYEVWLSEIMLQQTQVSTVLVYFPKFLARFPDVASLAAASQEAVLGLWSGLGYYSRARNLHACAQAVMNDHGGQFPRSAAVLQTLPGIGRSTAAAIAAFCFDERAAILDGNVKRVLSRVLGFSGDLSRLANERLLWQHADALLPQDAQHMPRYTQGLMDLGALVCRARQPDCTACPMPPLCQGQQSGAPEQWPVRTKKLKRTVQSWWLLWLENEHGEVWLQTRPQTGIWAGLTCLPLGPSRDLLLNLVSSAMAGAGADAGAWSSGQSGAALTMDERPAFKHVLTHLDLYLHPIKIQVKAAQMSGSDALPGRWVAAARWAQLGLPAPIRQLLGG